LPDRGLDVLSLTRPRPGTLRDSCGPFVVDEDRFTRIVDLPDGTTWPRWRPGPWGRFWRA